MGKGRLRDADKHTLVFAIIDLMRCSPKPGKAQNACCCAFGFELVTLLLQTFKLLVE